MQIGMALPYAVRQVLRRTFRLTETSRFRTMGAWRMTCGECPPGGVSEAVAVMADTGKSGSRPQITLRSDVCAYLKGAETQSWQADFKDSACAISLPS